MPDSFPKWEDTSPINEVPLFEDTQPIGEVPAFEQTTTPTVRDEVRAAIPEIVSQIRQAVVQPPQMAEFTPEQLNLTEQTPPEGDTTKSVVKGFGPPQPSTYVPPAQVLAQQMPGYEVERGGTAISGALPPPPAPKKREAVLRAPTEEEASGAVIRPYSRQDLSMSRRLGRDISGAVGGMVEGAGQTLQMAGIGYKKLSEKMGDSEALNTVGYLLERSGQAVAGKGKELAGKMAFEDPSLLDKVVSGATTSATFVIPGIGVSRVGTALTAFPRIAEAFGIATSTLMESSIESGLARAEAIDKGFSPEKADQIASRVFLANLPITAIGNKLGVFAKADGVVGKFARGVLAEGGQEYLQQVASNVPAGKEATAGAAEAGLIGGLIGGGLGVVEGAVPRPQAPAPVPAAQAEGAAPVIDAQKLNQILDRAPKFEETQPVESAKPKVQSDLREEELARRSDEAAQGLTERPTAPVEAPAPVEQKQPEWMQTREGPEWDAYAAEQNRISRERGAKNTVDKWRTTGISGNGIANFLRAKDVVIPKSIARGLEHDDTTVSSTEVSGKLKRPEARRIHKWVSENMAPFLKDYPELVSVPPTLAPAPTPQMPPAPQTQQEARDSFRQAVDAQLSPKSEPVKDIFTREEIEVSKPQVTRRKSIGGVSGRSVTNISAPGKVLETENWNKFPDTDMLHAHVSGNIDFKTGKVPLRKDPVWTAYSGRTTDRNTKVIRAQVPYNEAVEIAKDYVHYANPNRQAEFEARKAKAISDKEAQIKASEAKIAKTEGSSSTPAKTMPKAPADAISEAIKSIGFPEDAQVSKNLRLYNLVEMFRGMTGGVPQVVARFTDPSVLGKASAKGRIRLRAALGQNESMAALVLSHEMAHVSDAAYGDTKQTYARGNILGRLGAMDRYLYDHLDTAMSPRDVMVGRMKEMKTGVLEQARKQADEAKLKGPARAEFIRAKTRELTNPALAADGYVSKATITKELTDLARWWNKDPNFKGKGVELYAEGMSVYMLTPKDVATRAPHFYDVVKNWIQKKPEFEQAINEFWSNLEKGPAEGAKRINNKLIENFQKHRDARAVAEEKVIAAKDSLSALDLAAMALDYTIPMTNKMSQMGLHPWDSPYHEIQGWTHAAAPKEAYLRKVNDNIRKAVLDSNILTEDMVALQLLLNRVALGDRSEFLNSLGVTKQSAPEQLASLKEDSGDEYGKLQEIVEKVYDAHREILADGKGVLNEAGLKKLLDNRYYATFSLTKFIEEARGGGGEVGKLIHPQIGSLDDVGSPLEALIEKDVRLQYTFLRSKAFQAFYEWGNKLNDGTVLPAERTSSGNFKSAPAGYELVHWLWDSKIQGMYVKDGYWHIFKKQPTEAARYASVGEAALKFFKYVFVNLNPAFFATNVIRDSFFTSANLAELPFFSTKQKYLFGPLESLVRSMSELPAAVRHQLGKETSQAIQELKAMGITQSEYNRDMARLTKGLERMIAANGIFTEGKKIESPGQALLRAMEIALDVGRASDMASKVAALKLLKEKHPDASPAWLAHMIRTRAGTPDTTNKGALTSIYNWIWMYSQVAFAGWRGNIAAARENPQAFAIKMVGQAIIPKLLIIAAAKGMIGYDDKNKEEVKKVVDGIPEWFKASSLVIPIPILTDTGKSVFITIPQDEMSRTVGGVFYYMVKNMGENEQRTLISDMLESLKPAFDFAFSQAPGLNPLIQTVMQGVALADLPQGEGPKDSFGRAMIPARRIDAWSAKKFSEGKGPALVAYGKNWWNFAGLGTFFGKFNEKPEEVTSVLEDFFRLPFGGAMLNRFVRVSDAGATTRAYEAKAEAKAERAVVINKRIDRMLELHNEFTKANGRQPKISEINQFRSTIKAEMPEAMKGISVAEFQRSYNSYVVAAKGRLGKLQSLFKSGSNESKAEALKQLRKELPPADFNTVVGQARRDGMLSGKAMRISRE